MVGNFRGVSIFVIFVVDSAVTKISPYDYMYMYYDYNAHESDDDISKRVQ